MQAFFLIRCFSIESRLHFRAWQYAVEQHAPGASANIRTHNELASFLTWQKGELGRLGVDVKLNTEFTEDMLTDDIDAVIGGGEVGVETTELIASERKKVGIFEMMDAIAKEGESSVNHFVFQYLEKRDVDIFTNATVKEIKKDSIVFEVNGEEKIYLDVDAVVLALGSRSYNPLEEKLQGKVKKLAVIGDALKVNQGIEAIEKGYIVGYDI